MDVSELPLLHIQHINNYLVWLSQYCYLIMAISVWLSLYGYLSMAISVWLSHWLSHIPHYCLLQDRSIRVNRHTR